MAAGRAGFRRLRRTYDLRTPGALDRYWARLEILCTLWRAPSRPMLCAWVQSEQACPVLLRLLRSGDPYQQGCSVRKQLSGRCRPQLGATVWYGACSIRLLTPGLTLSKRHAGRTGWGSASR